MLRITTLVVLLGVRVGQDAPSKASVDRALATLSKASDPDESKAALLVLVQSKDLGVLKKVAAFLEDESFLDRLDPPGGGRTPRLNLVLTAMAKLETPDSEAILLSIGSNNTFSGKSQRVSGLINALAVIKKPSGKVLEYLDKKAGPDSAFIFRVIECLTRMHTPEAMALIDKRLASPDFSSDHKASWFLNVFLWQRNDPAIVAFYERIFRDGMKEPDLRNYVVGTLFDYQPFDWFGPEIGRQTPPARKDASTEVLQRMKKLAAQAMQWELNEKNKTAVRAADKEIDQLLKSREKK